MRTLEKEQFRASEGQDFALGCCADLRCATSSHTQDPFLTFVGCICRTVPVDHNQTPAVSVQRQ